MVYVFIILLLLLLVYYYDYKGYKKNRELWYKVVLLLLILIAGLRYRIGIDTPAYMYDFFHETPSFDDLKLGDLNIGNYPFWNLVNSFFYTIGAKFFMVQLFEAAFVSILILRYIKKHSPYIFTSVLLFFVWMYASYSMEAMKAGFSMSLCLFANDCFINKKYIKYVFISLIAFLFHPSSILITIMSMMTFFKINRIGLIVLCIAFFAGSMIQIIYGDLIMLFSFNEYVYNKAFTYGNSDVFFVVENKNVYYYIAHYFMILIPTLISFWVVKSQNTRSSIMKFEPQLFLALFFLTMSVNIFIFFRIYYFYVIYIILFLSQAIVDLWKNLSVRTSLVKGLLIVFPFMIFVYFSYLGERWKRYYPYASVIDKTVDLNRERMYSEVRTGAFSLPSNGDEY